MENFNIRNGSQSEIENFPLFNEDNEGNTIYVVESDGVIVAYAQMNCETIGFMESIVKGAGGALMVFLQENYSHLVADNVVKTARGFYEKFGFIDCERNYYGQPCMDWYPEE